MKEILCQNQLNVSTVQNSRPEEVVIIPLLAVLNRRQKLVVVGFLGKNQEGDFMAYYIARSVKSERRTVNFNIDEFIRFEVSYRLFNANNDEEALIKVKKFSEDDADCLTGSFKYLDTNELLRFVYEGHVGIKLIGENPPTHGFLIDTIFYKLKNRYDLEEINMQQNEHCVEIIMLGRNEQLENKLKNKINSVVSKKNNNLENIKDSWFCVCAIYDLDPKLEILAECMFIINAADFDEALEIFLRDFKDYFNDFLFVREGGYIYDYPYDDNSELNYIRFEVANDNILQSFLSNEDVDLILI